MIRLAINWVPFESGSDREIQQTKALREFQRLSPGWCKSLLCVLPGEPIPVHPQVVILPRDSYWAFPQGRHLPYLRDMLDAAVSGLDERSWGGVLNSDVFVTPGLFDFLESLESEKAFVTLHRTELKRWGDPIESGLRWGRRKSLEGLLIRADQWRKLKRYCPDFIVSEPYWDTGMILWSERQELESTHTHEVLHFRHAKSWKFGSPGAQHNLKLKEALG